jgi:hypothetical protein
MEARVLLTNNLCQNEKKGTILLVIISLLGLFLEAMYYSYFVFSYFIIFFVILIIVVLPTSYAILFRSEQKYLNLFLILVVSFFFNMTYLFYSLSLPYIPPQDALYHLQITDAIVKTHHIPIIGNVMDPYSAFALRSTSQYPAYHLLSASFSMTTGLTPELIIKLSPLIALVDPLIMFSLSKYVFKSDQISFLAAFLWVFVPFSYPLPSYTLLAYIFLPIFLLLFVKLKNARNRAFFINSLFFVFSLSFTHHLSSYILLAFLPFLYLFERVIPRISERVYFLRRGNTKVPKAGNIVSSETSGKLILSLFGFGIPWIIFFGAPALTYFIQTFQKIIPGTYVGTFPQQLSLSSGSTTLFEKILITTSFVLVGLLSLYGFFKYIRRGNWRHEWVTATTYFGLITIVTLSMINLSPDTANLALRSPHYLFISLSPLFGYAVVQALTTARGKYLKINAARWLILLLLVCFCISVADQTPRGYYFFRNEQVTGQLWEARSASSSISNGLQWYSSYTAYSVLGISDVPIHDIGTGNYNLSLTYYNELYVTPSNISKNTIQLIEMGASYVFIDSLMSNYTEQWTYLVYSKPIPVSNLNMIEQNYTSFDKVYSNGVIDTLYINK